MHALRGLCTGLLSLSRETTMWRTNLGQARERGRQQIREAGALGLVARSLCLVR